MHLSMLFPKQEVGGGERISSGGEFDLKRNFELTIFIDFISTL